MKQKKFEAVKLSKVAEMPPVYHKMPGQKYETLKSEAIQWMIKQPELMEYLWDHVKQSKFVEYDYETGMWIGKEYDGGLQK